AGARISAGKSGRVARSLPRTAVAFVNRSPVSCIPSPESPANLTTTRSFSMAVFGAISLLRRRPPRGPRFGLPDVRLTLLRASRNPSVAERTARLGGLVERVAAGAAAGGQRVVDGEPRGLERVDEVDLGLLEVRDAHPVDHNPDTELLGRLVGLGELVVQIHRVAETRPPAGLNGDPPGY